MLNKGRFPANCVTTEPDAFFSPYFNVTPKHLCKKASKRDRNSDWRGEEITLPERILEKEAPLRHAENRTTSARNTHPTVKPTDLMAWLVRLVTPPGGIVLDPFAGSGTTLVAAKREGFQYIGIEREAEYVEIAKERTTITNFLYTGGGDSGKGNYREKRK
jgi:site-specific DNA-methyltransferase (adenine-specific)